MHIWDRCRRILSCPLPYKNILTKEHPLSVFTFIPTVVCCIYNLVVAYIKQLHTLTHTHWKHILYLSAFIDNLISSQYIWDFNSFLKVYYMCAGKEWHILLLKFDRQSYEGVDFKFILTPTAYRTNRYSD